MANIALAWGYDWDMTTYVLGLQDRAKAEDIAARVSRFQKGRDPGKR